MRGAQSRKILLGVAQPVRVINANAIEHSVAKPLQNPGVRGNENMRALHAHANQGVDVEEAPVSEILVGSAPVGQPIILQIEDCIECIVVLVELVHSPRDCFRCARLFFAEALQQFIEDGFVAMTRSHYLVLG